MRSKLAIRLVNNPTIEAFKSSIKLKVAEAPRYLQTIKDENKKIFFHKLGSLNKWYNNIIGLDEVNVYLERVAALQKELLTTQEKRREIGGQLNEIRQKSNEVQDKIQQVDRKEKFNVYCELIKEEREIIFLERTATNKFQEYDQMERDLFTAFTNAVRDSNEKQRAQVEYTKYLGFILSITGSFLAFIYTTYKKNDLKRFIDEKLATVVFPSDYQSIIRKFNEQLKTNEQLMREILNNRAALGQIITQLSDKNQNYNYRPQSMQVEILPILDEREKVILIYLGGFVGICLMAAMCCSH